MHRVTLYHNPECGTSRNTLALIRHLGIEPEIILYLQTPPNEAVLKQLLAQMALTPRQLLRTNVAPYQALQLDNPELSDADLIAAMLAEPLLINRPIAVTEKGARLCRPSEVFLEISPLPLQDSFVKEDGSIIRGAQ